MPSAAARSSISVSWAIAACGTPKPRKAPDGATLVWIARVVHRAASTAYGPVAWTGTRLATVGPPRCVRARVEVAVDADPGEAPVRVGAEGGGDPDAGWRFVVDAHRLRAGVHAAHRPARARAPRSRSAAGSTGRACRRSRRRRRDGMTRTRSGGRPRISASSSRSMYGVWVVAKTSTRPSTTRAVPASGSMYACSTNVVSNVPVAVTADARERGVDVAALDTPAHEHVPRPSRRGGGARRASARGRDPEQRRSSGSQAIGTSSSRIAATIARRRRRARARPRPR